MTDPNGNVSRETEYKQVCMTISPDHASREAFSELFRAGTHHRSDQLIGASPLTMQRVWGLICLCGGSSGHDAPPLTARPA